MDKIRCKFERKRLFTSNARHNLHALSLVHCLNDFQSITFRHFGIWKLFLLVLLTSLLIGGWAEARQIFDVICICEDSFGHLHDIWESYYLCKRPHISNILVTIYPLRMPRTNISNLNPCKYGLYTYTLEGCILVGLSFFFDKVSTP